QVGQLTQRARPLYLLRFLDGIAVPQPLNGHAFASQFLIEGFQLFNSHRPVPIGLVVKDTQSNDLVLVLLNKLTESTDNPVSVFLSLDVKPSKEQGIRISIVDNLLMAASDILDKIPHLWTAERRSGLRCRFSLHRLHLLFRGLLGLELLLCLGSENILVKGVEQLLRQLIGGNTHYLRKFLSLAGIHLTVEPDHPIGKRGQG